MPSDDRHPFRPIYKNTNSSARRKEPDEKCEGQISPDTKRLHLTEDIDSRNITGRDNVQQRRKVSFQNTKEDSAYLIVKQCLSAVFEEHEQGKTRKDIVRERWKRISKLALEYKRRGYFDHNPISEKTHEEAPVILKDAKEKNEMKLELCSAEQIDIMIKFIFRRCPFDVTYEEKMHSIKSYRDKSYKKDSRKWLHKSSKKARTDRESEMPPNTVPPKTAISKENFRLLLEAHEDDRVNEYLADTAPDVDTNTSAFDRINLGAFYEEHQRQKEMLEEKEEWNHRKTQTREAGIRKSVRNHDLTNWRPTRSLPNIPAEVNESEDERRMSPEKENRLGDEDLSRHYMAFNSSNNEFYEEHGTVKLKRSLSDSMLDNIHLRVSTSDRYDTRGMVNYMDRRSVDSLDLPSVPLQDVTTEYCVTPPGNEFRATEMEYVTWEDIDRNAMARYNCSPAEIYNTKPNNNSRTLQQDQFSIPDSNSDTSLNQVDNRHGKQHSLSPSSGDDRLNQF